MNRTKESRKKSKRPYALYVEYNNDGSFDAAIRGNPSKALVKQVLIRMLKDVKQSEKQ
jgi:hypothetical protein